MKVLAIALPSLVGLALVLSYPCEARSLEEKAVEVGPGIEPPREGGVVVIPTPKGTPAGDEHATVTVRLLVDAHGYTRKPRAVDAPSPLLGDAAVAAVADSRWQAATEAGKPVLVWWQRKVRFRPQSELDSEIPPLDCISSRSQPLRPEPLTDDVELPRLLETAHPEYPPQEKRDLVSGRAGVVCVLDTCGRMQDCSVIFAGRSAFGVATQAAAMKRRYAPARRNGQPVAVYMTVVSDFAIH